MAVWNSLCLKNPIGFVGVVTKRWKSTVRKLDKVLIANRGEIACRVIRTARRLGVRTVAVYSEADENALHVTMADEAYKIGPPPVIQSYLRGDKILEVAKKSGCHAIHPGYGFLSENVEFAENCQKSGIIFVGPPSTAIRDMGIKSKSKEIMSRAGVPIIAGYHGEDQSNDRLKSEAIKIGFPVMIKAVRGGGGKGMRIAYTEGEFDEALESARSESHKSFGDSVVLLEQFLTEPRHVEVQIFADSYGNVVHLFERDCSVQRRHQKIIEEAPAPGLAQDLRDQLGVAAVRAAKAVGYVGAGTVEFILDKNTHSFHFMEMNTRLQVEHPITEMITGTDLVEWQIKIAKGEKLPLTQEEIPSKGHAFEARIYAEDPKNAFLPGAGTLVHLSTPETREDVRIDSGVREGDEVSVHYDPMIAKLVVWGENRSEALSKLQSSLVQYNVAGLETNVNFLLDLARHPEFVSGNVHTNFIEDNYDSLFKKIARSDVHNEVRLIQGALAKILNDEMLDIGDSMDRNDRFNPFIVENGFRMNYLKSIEIRLNPCDDDCNEIHVLVKYNGYNIFHVSTNQGQSWRIVKGELYRRGDNLGIECTIDGTKTKADVFVNDEILALFDNGGKSQFKLDKPTFFHLQQDDDISRRGSDKAVAPMPGVLDKILVKSGDRVAKGDSLFVLIAMKMEQVVKAKRDGVVSDVLYKIGDNVQKDATIVQFQEHSCDEQVVEQ